MDKEQIYEFITRVCNSTEKHTQQERIFTEWVDKLNKQKIIDREIVDFVNAKIYTR